MAPSSRDQVIDPARAAAAGHGPRLLWSPDDTDPGWFHTAEWEMAADWDAPQESAWETAEVPQAPVAGFDAAAFETVELPAWLSGQVEAQNGPEALDAPPTVALSRPLPRRRDLRAGGTHHTLPSRREVDVIPVTGSLLLTELPDTDAPRPAGVATVLPRRRDVRRGRRDVSSVAALDSVDSVFPPQAGDLAVTGDGLGAVAAPADVPPTTGELRRPRTRQPEPHSRMATTVARAGVVSVLVAVGAATIGGQQFGLGVGDHGAGTGAGDAAARLSPAEARDAIRIAPVANAAPVNLWGSGIRGDVRAKFGTDVGEGAAQGLADAHENVSWLAGELTAQRKRAQAAAAAAAAAHAKALRDEENARAARIAAAGGVKGLAMDMMQSEYGWGTSQFQCLNLLWKRESGWNYRARNPYSGAYGIPQALPGSKMASAGSDWRTNPATQIEWGLDYIHDRYGTPCGAWSHSERTGWY